MTGFARERDVAIRLAIEAAQFIREAAKAGFECSEKGTGDLVTSADLGADALLCAGLRASFPGDALLTEESGWLGGSGERVWIVDPLDGTKAFARGEPGACVHVALHAEGVLRLGVVADPAGERVAWAVAGEGAWESDETGGALVRLERIRSPASRPRLVVSQSMPSGRREALLGACDWAGGPQVRGAGYKTLTICRGEGDVYFSEHPLHVWDTAAPVMIALEAGASVSTLSGDAWSFPLESPWLHEGLLVVAAGIDPAFARDRLQEAWSDLLLEG